MSDLSHGGLADLSHGGLADLSHGGLADLSHGGLSDLGLPADWHFGQGPAPVPTCPDTLTDIWDRAIARRKRKRDE